MMSKMLTLIFTPCRADWRKNGSSKVFHVKEGETILCPSALTSDYELQVFINEEVQK